MANTETQFALPIVIPEPANSDRIFRLSIKLIRLQARVTELTRLFNRLARECEKELSDARDLLNEILASDSALHCLGSSNGEIVMADKKAGKKDYGKKGNTPKDPAVVEKKKKKKS